MGGSADEVELELLGGFTCRREGRAIVLPLGAQRLLAFLGLHRRSAHRVAVSGKLWPYSTRDRAAANLRSALWRCCHVDGVTLVDRTGPCLAIHPAVRVDLLEVERHTGERSWLHSGTGPLRSLTRELLPDWSDEWLIFERERWDQHRLCALEDMAEDLVDAGYYRSALEAALAATFVEPIRESAHRLVMRAHVSQGNIATAIRHYERYRRLLQRELGVAPSPQMDKLVHPFMLS